MEETPNEIRIFYKQFYTSTNTGDGNFFENLTINNTLTETDRQKCEGYITKQEYLSAVAIIKNNKSPGDQTESQMNFIKCSPRNSLLS